MFKIFCWLQYIHQMIVGTPSISSGVILAEPDIHMAVNLHGIRGNDLLRLLLLQGQWKALFFPTAVGPVSTIRGFFHIFPPFMLSILHDTFEFFFQFLSYSWQ